MESITKALEFYKNNNYISCELIDDFKNISKMELFEIIEKEDKEEIISFVKILQQQSYYDECCIHKDECIVCYENKTGILTNCNHFLCFDCYIHLEMRKNVYIFCPMCRRKIVENDEFNDILNTVFYDHFSHYKMNELLQMFGRNNNNNDIEYESFEENEESFFINVHDDMNMIDDSYEISDVDQWANDISIDHYLSGN